MVNFFKFMKSCRNLLLKTFEICLPYESYFTGDIKVGVLFPVIAVPCAVVLLPAFILIYKRYGMLIYFLRGRFSFIMN